MKKSISQNKDNPNTAHYLSTKKTETTTEKMTKVTMEPENRLM